MARKERIEKKISRILVDKTLITEEQQTSLLQKAQETNTSLETLILKENILSEGAYLGALANVSNIAPILLSQYIPNKALQPLIPRDRAEAWGVIPVEMVKDVLTIAITDPFNILVLDEIKSFITSSEENEKPEGKKKSVRKPKHFFPVLTTEMSLEKSYEEFFKSEAELMEDQMGEIVQQLNLDPNFIAAEEDEGNEVEEDDSAIVKLVNTIILQAHSSNASDIHLEPYTEKDIVVRFRVDGECKKIMEIPRHYKNALASRIKIMCGLDIAEKRLPQDGKIKFKQYGPRDIELRVAVIPTVGGNEDIVMRILAASKPIPLDKAGMIESTFEGVKSIVDKPYGIFLVVGPTGSGKTTTLHSCLGYINEESTKIWTAEDPVEITQYGLRQVQCHPKIGYDFKRAMRAFLRGDPDVIMIGEMRDLETAAIGIEASLTGHLVFSTLHTNNAPETIIRLLDLGIDPFSFADALLGVLAQRLIKTLCKACKKEYSPTPEEIQHLINEMGGIDQFRRTGVDPNSSFKLMQAGNCNACGGTGYKGRMGIHELLKTSPEMKRLIFTRAKAADVRAEAIKNGMFTLKQDGIIKVLAGHAGLKEILRVCIE